MKERGVGRLLVASLHQGIADLLPGRLAFYEAWLNPSGLRNGRIGLAPLAAVLSFLRQEGEAYQLVTARAGEYTADWTMAATSPVTRIVLRAAPRRLRMRLALRLVRRMVQRTTGGARAIVRRRAGGRLVDLRGSPFCDVRRPVLEPMCGFYVAAIRRVLALARVEADVASDGCRAVGAVGCVLVVRVRGGKVREAGT